MSEPFIQNYVLFLSETGYLYEQERKLNPKNKYTVPDGDCISKAYIDDPAMIRCYACSGWRYRIPKNKQYKPCNICNDIPFKPWEV